MKCTRKERNKIDINNRVRKSHTWCIIKYKLHLKIDLLTYPSKNCIFDSCLLIVWHHISIGVDNFKKFNSFARLKVRTCLDAVGFIPVVYFKKNHHKTQKYFVHFWRMNLLFKN